MIVHITHQFLQQLQELLHGHNNASEWLLFHWRGCVFFVFQGYMAAVLFLLQNNQGIS